MGAPRRAPLIFSPMEIFHPVQRPPLAVASAKKGSKLTKRIEHSTDQCTHVIKSTGQRCGKHPIKGGTVCATPGHGGLLPSVRTAAAERAVREENERRARYRLKDRLAAGNITDALAEFERLIEEVTAFKDVCRERVDELTQIRYEGKAGEQLRSEVAVYERALDRCEKVLSSGIRLGLAKRRQELNEAEALMIVAAFKELLDKLDLSKDQQVTAGRVVPEILRGISTKVESVKVVRK